MRTQSQADVERICYQNILNEAEAYMNAQDEEPTAEECFAECVHAAACARMLEVVGKYEPDEIRELERSGSIGAELICDECEEYEDAWCPMSLSGTMRCQGPKTTERKGNS